MLDYIKNTKNHVDDNFIHSASHNILKGIYDKIPLNNFVKPMVIVALNGLLGYFVVNKFIKQMFTNVIYGIHDFVKQKSTEMKNVLSNATTYTIKKIDNILPIWSYYYSKQREYDNTNQCWEIYAKILTWRSRVFDDGNTRRHNANNFLA